MNCHFEDLTIKRLPTLSLPSNITVEHFCSVARTNKRNAVICSHSQAKPMRDSPASAFSQATEWDMITGPCSKENKKGHDYWESLCGDSGKPNSINKCWLHPQDSLQLNLVISPINVNNSPPELLPRYYHRGWNFINSEDGGRCGGKKCQLERPNNICVTWREFYFSAVVHKLV